MNVSSTLSSGDFPGWLVVSLTVLAAVICFVTVLTNVVVLLSFAVDRNIRKPQNYLLGCLALCDLVIGSVAMPLFVQYMYLDEWLLPDWVCVTWLVVDFSACNAARGVMLLITTDRYLSLKFPWTYKAYQTKRNVFVAVAIIWTVCLLIYATSIAGWPYMVDVDMVLAKGSCHVLFMNDLAFTLMYVIGCFWVPLLYVCVLYRKIYVIALSVASGSLEKSAASRNRTGWNGATGVQQKRPKSKRWGSNRVIPASEIDDVRKMDVIEDVSDADMCSSDKQGIGQQKTCMSSKQDAGCISRQDTPTSRNPNTGSNGRQDTRTVRKHNTRSIGCQDKITGSKQVSSLVTDDTVKTDREKDTANEVSQIVESIHSVDMDLDSPQFEVGKEGDTQPPRTRYRTFPPPAAAVGRENESDSKQTAFGNDERGTAKTRDDAVVKNVEAKNYSDSVNITDDDEASDESARNETDEEEEDANENAKTNDNVANVKTTQKAVSVGESSQFLHPTTAMVGNRANKHRLSISSNTTEDMTFHTTDSLDDDVMDLSDEITMMSPALQSKQREIGKAKTLPTFARNALKPLKSAFASGSASVAWQHRFGPMRWTSGLATSRRKTRQMYQSHVRKALRIITLILSVYIVAWTPYFVLVTTIVVSGGHAYINPTLYTITYCLCYLNSTFNPVCYALANAEFRRAFVKIIKCNWRVV